LLLLRTPPEYRPEPRPISDRKPAYDPWVAEPSAPDARTTLDIERARLREELTRGIVAPDPMTYGSQAAAATQVFEQQRDLALRDKNEQQLQAVDAALARIDAGAFGTCVRCGRPIAPERLEALPWAAHCIDCQRIVAKRG
jgi:RNA polymerase-binding protein DksA